MRSQTIAQEIEDVLDQAGFPARELVWISEHERVGRTAFRAVFEDGRQVKVRAFESEEAARRLASLRSDLEPAFAPVVAQHGRVLIEAWVDGVPIDADDPMRVAEAGAILGRLHAAHAEGRESAAGLIDQLVQRLGVLVEAGVISPSGAKRLRARLADLAPREVLVTRIHRDFHPVNMIADEAGALRLIDNEWMEVGLAGVDVGLTFVHWPMTPALSDRFLSAYREAGAPDLGRRAFWRLASGVLRSEWRPPQPVGEGSVDQWRQAAAAPLIGWDLKQRFGGGRSQTPLPWTYGELAIEAADGRERLLDIGTGGGELLERLAPSLSAQVTATEGFAPNVEVARKRLSRHGIEVVATEDKRLPIEDGAFDIVVNSCAPYRPDEIARVLEAGGVYFTQQYDSSSKASLCDAFDHDVDLVKGTLEERVDALKAAGFEIEATRSADFDHIYADVATLAGHLSVMPWLVPDFSVDRYREHLDRLQSELELAGELRFGRRMLLIRARKPGST